MEGMQIGHSTLTGTPLLVPLLNTFDTLDPVSFERNYISSWLGSVQDVFAKIDGVTIDPANYLETTGVFSMGKAQPDSWIAKLAESAGIDTSNLQLSPTMATGYYLMIDNLSEGAHTLEFGGKTVDAATGKVNFSTRTIDHIIVS
jgi:hypothetical protein